MTEVISSENPQLFQFKNALHFGFISSQQGHIEPSKNGHLSSRDTQFNRSTSQRSFSPSKSPSNRKQKIQRVGLSIDDEGNVLLGSWNQGKIEGKYFLFKANTVGDYRMDNQFIGICQYGSMMKGQLQGDNYLYTFDGTIVKSTFRQDKIGKKWYLCPKRSSQSINQQNIQCEVYKIQQSKEEYTIKSNQEKLRIPHFSEISPKKCQHKDQKEITSIINPLEFLKLIIAENKKLSQQKNLKSLKFIELNQNHIFFGFIESKTKQNQDYHHSEQPLNGFGVVLKNSWPYQYGSFINGTLQGLGRKYQNQISLQDGFFINGILLQGHLLDYQSQKIYFGKNSLTKNQEIKDNEFVISKTVNINQVHVLASYKKNHHLQSLTYLNNYFNVSNLLNHSPWPYTVISNLQRKNNLRQMLRSYDNNSELSQEVKSHKDKKQTGYRVERGKELKRKNIKDGIEIYLNKRKNERFEKTLVNNFVEYQKIKTVANSNQTPINHKQHNKSSLKLQSKNFPEESKEKRPQVSKLISSSQKQHDLNELLQTYSKYQQQKKRIREPTNEKEYFDQTNQNNETLRKRKSHLPIPGSSRTARTFNKKSSERKYSPGKFTGSPILSLDQIYKLYLKI